MGAPTDQNAPQTQADDAPKGKTAKFAPTLTQPLASVPPSEQITVQPALVSASTKAPHYYDHTFIIEQLNKFVDNPFDGEVASLPISVEVIAQAGSFVNDRR